MYIYISYSFVWQRCRAELSGLNCTNLCQTALNVLWRKLIFSPGIY